MKKLDGKPFLIAQFIGLQAAVAVARVLPARVLRAGCRILGRFLYTAFHNRRRIAENNIRIAFGNELDAAEVKRLALRSCEALFLTAAELMSTRFQVKNGKLVPDKRYKTQHLQELFQKAKKIHDAAGGCIFITPHLGNWEMLPYVAALIDIPLAIVMRPLDNPYLESSVLSSRTATSHVIIPKKNAMFVLERMLKQGKSLAMLPDQSTSRGLQVEFFGRMATATPIPALLAVHNNRPVVVVAACRTDDPSYFEGYVSDPVVPRQNLPVRGGEQAEILRITREINREMETIIRRYPEQYFWLHNRWKKSPRKPIFMNRRVKQK